jgi:hypothetical protein
MPMWIFAVVDDARSLPAASAARSGRTSGTEAPC